MPKFLAKLGAVAAIANTASTVPSLAQEAGYPKIGAQYMITGKDLDPPPNQKKDRVALFLTGDGARKIYDAMPSIPVKADVCEEGLRLKTSGGLVCERHGDGSYACSVAILLKSGQTAQFGSC